MKALLRVRIEGCRTWLEGLDQTTAVNGSLLSGAHELAAGDTFEVCGARVVYRAATPTRSPAPVPSSDFCARAVQEVERGIRSGDSCLVLAFRFEASGAGRSVLESSIRRTLRTIDTIAWFGPKSCG